MRKKEILSLVESLSLSVDSFCILSTASLVIRGIVEEAGDLDLLVTKEGYDLLTKRYTLIPKEGDSFEILTEQIEILQVKAIDCDVVEGLPLEKLQIMYDFYATSGREKDQAKCELLKPYLGMFHK